MPAALALLIKWHVHMARKDRVRARCGNLRKGIIPADRRISARALRPQQRVMRDHDDRARIAFQCRQVCQRRIEGGRFDHPVRPRKAALRPHGGAQRHQHHIARGELATHGLRQPVIAPERVGEAFPRVVIGHVVVAGFQHHRHAERGEPLLGAGIFGMPGALGQIAGADHRIGALCRHRARRRIKRGGIFNPEMHVADMEQACGHRAKPIPAR